METYSWKSDSKECKANLECKKSKMWSKPYKGVVTIWQSWLNMQAVPLANSIF